MKVSNNIAKYFSAVALAVALLLPSGVQLVHAFDGHRHLSCEDISTHIHETPLDCSICMFQNGTYAYYGLHPSEETQIIEISKVSTYAAFEFYQPVNSYKSLRAPPALV